MNIRANQITINSRIHCSPLRQVQGGYLMDCLEQRWFSNTFGEPQSGRDSHNNSRPTLIVFRVVYRPISSTTISYKASHHSNIAVGENNDSLHRGRSQRPDRNRADIQCQCMDGSLHTSETVPRFAADQGHLRRRPVLKNTAVLHKAKQLFEQTL